MWDVNLRCQWWRSNTFCLCPSWPPHLHFLPHYMKITRLPVLAELFDKHLLYLVLPHWGGVPWIFWDPAPFLLKSCASALLFTPERAKKLFLKHVFLKCPTVACLHNLQETWQSWVMTRLLVRPSKTCLSGCQKSISVYTHLSEHVAVKPACLHLWPFINTATLRFHLFIYLSKHLTLSITPFPSIHPTPQNFFDSLFLTQMIPFA